jgi:hypothetical protein
MKFRPLNAVALAVVFCAAVVSGEAQTARMKFDFGPGTAPKG